MKRRSKNREAILACLRGTDSHPTAERIYMQLKPAYPLLSLATVYRNLLSLEQEGSIRSAGFSGGREHFDGHPAPHAHAVCIACGRICDLHGAELSGILSEAERTAEEPFEFSGAVQLMGLCGACADKRRNQS